MNNPPKVALVYDRINKWGGAERVLLALHQLYPSAPIYTLVHNPNTSRWTKNIEIIPSFFSIPLFRKKHELLAPVAALGFEVFNFDQYDIVISVTSADAKAIITKPHTLHICYCLTPTRYLWSGMKEYKNNPGLKKFSQVASLGLHVFTNFLQKRDFIAAQRPDFYLSISKTIKERVKKYYKRDSDVIYPGIDFDFWSKVGDSKQSNDYYLVVSRLVPYKKVGLVIEAFRYLPHKLKIVGTGSQKLFLKRIAPSNVEFVGKVSDTKLRDLYRNAKALIFPQDEDFGLTPLESQATGTPVIAFAKGGSTETTVDKKTGVFFEHQTKESLIKAIEEFEKNITSFDPRTSQANAQRFSDSLFLSEFSGKVEALWQAHQKGRSI